MKFGYLFFYALILSISIILTSCGGNSDSSNGGGDDAPASDITPGWTIPAPPDATRNQSYTASVEEQTGCTYQWSVTTGSATLIDDTTNVLTFTPTALGSLVLQCVVTNESSVASTGTYTATVEDGAIINANPATITLGQGTILLANFTGTGVVNPGGLSITSGVGLTVSPTATTTYTLLVDGTAAATVIVKVEEFIPKFVYVAGDGEDAGGISAFLLNAGTGALTEISGSPYTDEYVNQLVADSKGNFLFGPGGTDGVNVYKINSTTGALSAVAGSPFNAESSTAMTIAVDPQGRFVYVNTDSMVIYAFKLNATTGALTPVTGSPFDTDYSNLRGEILVHPSGKYLYSVRSQDNKIEAFNINQSTGALVKFGTYDADASVTGPYGIAVNPTGAYLVIKGEADPSAIETFSVDIATGALVSVGVSSAITGSDSYHGLCFHPTKSILYTSFYNASFDIAAYTLDLTDGSLTEFADSPYDLFTTNGSDNITIDRSGQFAFAVNYDGAQMARMRVDADGHLTRMNGSDIGAKDVDTVSVVDQPISVVVTGAMQDVSAKK